MVKKAKQKLSVDEIREIILRFFYDIHEKASTPKKMLLKISEVKKGLKSIGLDGKEVMSNLDYLIQTDWIIKEEEISQIRTNKGIFPSKKVHYKASDKTINHFVGSSKYQKSHETTGINITNIKGVTVVGDKNIVNVDYHDLYNNLDLLSGEITKSNKFSDEEKLNYISEIETIKSQISKTNPDKSIIRKTWEKLKNLATIEGLSSLVEKIAQIINYLN